MSGRYNIPENHFIFPLLKGRKIPAKDSAGFHDALIKAEAERKWPDIYSGNVGLHPAPSGLLIVDVDIKPHKDGSPGVGIETIQALQSKHGKLPDTFTVKTPSGGWHLYFKKPDIAHIGNDSIGKDLDIRCNGGYVLEPGSKADGGTYEIIKNAPVADLPAAWVELFRPKQKPLQATGRLAMGGYGPTSRAEVQEALTYIPADLPYDEWVKVLAALKSGGFDDLAHSWSAGSPQYDPAEVERKLASFTGAGVNIATVFYYAKQGGYKSAVSPSYTAQRIKQIQQNPDEWPEPTPLPSGLAPVTAFDGELLPKALRGFVTDIAERMQCPPDFPAVTVMVSLGALIGRRCGIHPKRKDDWLAVPNLWGAIVGRPSLMKSPAIQQGMKPFDALIAEASKKHAAQMAAFETDSEVYKGKRKAWQDSIQKAAKDGKPTDGLLPPEKPAAPIERRLRTNAGSVECLINLLNENPDGLMMFRDELTGWLRNLDKAGKEGDRQFFLEAWNGNGSGFDYDTFTHGHLHCESLCLSILGSIQPGPLSHLIADAAKGGGGDDGMVQRFQLLVYPDSPGKWRNVDRWPDTEAKARVRRIFERLDSMTFPATDGDLPALRFNVEAQALFDEWREELELKVQNEQSPMIEAHLAKYRSLMPSLALLIHLAEIADSESALIPVTVDAATRAAAWCEYLETHARRVYGMQAMAEVEGARTLLMKLQRGDVQSPFTARQVYRNHWSRLSTPAEVEAACGILCDHEWLRSEEVRGEGRPTVTYTLNQKTAKKPAGGLPDQVPKVSKPPFGTFDTALPRPLTDEKQAVTA
jgi:putative DNA primase/helicase